MNEPTDRDQTIQGLRELADLLEAHPDLPVPCGPYISATVDLDFPRDGGARRAEVDRAAAILGVQAYDATSGHYRAEIEFTGGVEFGVAACDPGPKPGKCELCKDRRNPNPVHRHDPDHPNRITSRACTECLGDGPWDHAEHAAQVSE